MLSGFRAFLFRGNVVDLAVAVVIGGAFSAVVTAFVKDLITPIVAAIAGKRDFSALVFTINGSRFLIGDFLNAVIAFVLVAAAIYFFVIVPMRRVMELRQKEPVPEVKPCPYCLEDRPGRGHALQGLHLAVGKRHGLVRVCIYCGSSPGHDPRFVVAAKALGTALAEAGIGVVYGGGRVGLMGTVADAALAAGGEVIGVIPRFLEEREVAHVGVDLRVVESMHERKALMADLSDAFVALPGGFGTFEEFFEIVTWVQLRLIDAPCILANVDGYFDALIALIDGAAAKGFISAANRSIVEAYATVSAVMERLQLVSP